MNQELNFDNIDPKDRRLSMIGLAFGMLIACLDGTIVATCGSEIARDLNGMELYSWMITAYLLTETAMIPVAGKLSDRFGRKPLFLAGLLLFIIASVLSGLSTSMEMLIICRGIQGLGGGILVPVAMASVADFYSPDERGKIQGILGALFGIGSGCGPLIGGLICTYASWQWIFYVNVPLAIICLVLTIKKFPMVSESNLKPIDYLGMGILTLLILDVLLFFQWINGEMAITDPKSIAMIAAAVILIVLFIIRERKAEDPVISPKLARNRLILFSAIYLFLFGLTMLGVLTYIALYISVIYDYDSLECGLSLLPLVFGAMMTSMSSGMLVKKTGFKIWVFMGAVLITAALFLMSTLSGSQNLMLLFVYTFIFGLGMGCSTTTVMIAVQSVTPRNEMGMTTSAVSVTRNIGSTVGTALFAMIISGNMDSKFAETIYAPLAEMFDLSGTGLLALRYIPVPPGFEGVADAVVSIFDDSVCWTFLNGGCIFILAIFVALLMDGNRLIAIKKGKRSGYASNENDE